jgi:hypothetical protein
VAAPLALSHVSIAMQTVHESEAAVETWSHRINGKPERTGREELASDRGRHAQRRLMPRRQTRMALDEKLEHASAGSGKYFLSI